MTGKEKIRCPYCGYKMPVEKERTASCRGIWVRCKGKNCKKEFEIVIAKESDR